MSQDGSFVAGVMQGAFKAMGNTHSFVSCEYHTGVLALSNNDVHQPFGLRFLAESGLHMAFSSLLELQDGLKACCFQPRIAILMPA